MKNIQHITGKTVAGGFTNTLKSFGVTCRRQGGFTLVEVLLVIGIMSVLASIVIIAINPARQLQDARDAERLSDVYTIMNALHQYASDNDGAFPSMLTTSELEVCKTGVGSCGELYDLSILTDSEKYLVSIPVEPLCGTGSQYCTATTGTGYLLRKTSNGRIYITASSAENSVINIAR